MQFVNRKWMYLQRKTHCYLSPYIDAIGKVYAHDCQKVLFGKIFRDFFCIYTNGVLVWYGDETIISDLYTSVSKEILKQPEYLNQLYTKFLVKSKKLLAFSKKVSHQKLSLLTNKELWHLYDTYLQIYREATLYGEPLPLVTKEYVVDYLKKYIVQQVHLDVHRATEVLITLTMPVKKSFLREEEEALYTIAAEVQQKHLSLTSPTLRRKIAQHTQKYCWIPYDYGVKLWHTEHFMSALKTIVAKKNCSAELKKLREDAKHLRLQQRELLQKYNIDSYHKKLFVYVQLATYLMDLKKGIFTKSHSLFIPFINELARRFSTTAVFMRLYTYNEIRQALLNNKVLSPETLQQRYAQSVCVWDLKGDTSFISQNQVQWFIKNTVEVNTELTQGKKVYGTAVSLGKHIGRAKIVNSSAHVYKVEKGDVLIAPMTSPDYVVGMRKAGAIVTNEGGFTCHAAIVSRELRVPCIVGTKNATKVFRDGDLLEVNAQHGSITLLERT